MHVMGLSLTATSAVWVLLDTSSGAILAEEVVPVTSVDEVAKAAALSVQAFAGKAEHQIHRVHLTWTPDGRQHGVRLRSKLRLFGFDSIETLSQDEAREGRNRTARHIAPHLAMAYGAARSEHTDESGFPLQKLTALVPHPAPEPDGLRMRWSRFVDDARLSLHAAGRAPVRIAGGVAAAAVVGLVAYALIGTTTPAMIPAPADAATEPAQPVPEAAHVPAPPPVDTAPDTWAAVQPDVASVPESAPIAESVPPVESVTASESVTEAESVTAADSVTVVESVATPITESVVEAAPPASVAPLAPAEAAPITAGLHTGQTHLRGPAPVPGPAALPGPVAPVAPIAPAAPAPPAGPLSGFLGALP